MREACTESEQEGRWEEEDVDRTAAESFTDWSRYHRPETETEHVEGEREDGGRDADVEMSGNVRRAWTDHGRAKCAVRRC